MNKLMVVAIIVAVFPVISAAELDEHSQRALDQTQSMMRDRNQRQQAIQQSGKGAQKTDQMVQRLSGGDPAKADEIYGLAADVMKQITEMANGDPKKMMEILQKLQKNPEEFVKHWTPEQRQRLRQIAQDIEKPKSPPSP